MDVTRAFEEIRAILDQDRLVPTLPKMTHVPVRTVEPAWVASIELAGAGSQAAPGRFAKEMIGPRDEAERVHDHATVIDDALDSFEETASIAVVQKSRHPSNPARHHLVDGPGELYPCRPAHARSVSRPTLISQLEPRTKCTVPILRCGQHSGVRCTASVCVA